MTRKENLSRTHSNKASFSYSSEICSSLYPKSENPSLRFKLDEVNIIQMETQRSSLELFGGLDHLVCEIPFRTENKIYKILMRQNDMILSPSNKRDSGEEYYD